MKFISGTIRTGIASTVLRFPKKLGTQAMCCAVAACGGMACGDVLLETGFEGSSNLPSGWMQSQISGSATWKIQTGGYTGGGNPATAHSGTNNATLFIANRNENKTQLLSPTFNTGGYSNLTLKFWHFQQLWGSDQDELKVFYSINGGTSWTQLAHYTNNQYYWMERTITLPAASTNSRIAFEGYAKYGLGVCLDDIQVTGNATTTPEVSVTASDTSASEAGQATGTWTITRVGNTTGASSVHFTLSGSATQGSDYTVSPSSPVNFAAGETSKVVTLTPIDDTVGGEGNEVATLTLASGAGYNIGIASADISIVDDEGYDLNVLIIGSTKDSADTSAMTGTSDPFNPTGLRTQLQSILQGAGLGTVNVTLIDRDTQYSLAQWFHNPLPAGDDVNNRWPNLRGELGTQWDKVILIGDPYTMEYMPGVYAYGASQIAAEVAKGTAETVLFMPWPASGSSSTVDHYKEVVYRTGRSAGLKVAPAGLAWQSTGSTTNTTRRDFISAASIFSAVWGQSAKDSTYVYDDSLADNVHSVVTTQNAAQQYTGTFSFQNPFLMLGDKRRDIHFSEKGTSTEEDFRQAAGRAIQRASCSFNAASYNDKYNSDTPGDDGLGWPVGNAMPIAWNHGRKFAETNKEYVVNPAYWQLGMGFMYQSNTWSLSVEEANDTQIKAIFPNDLYLANFMKGQHATARCIPWRLIWAQIHQEYPTLNPLSDGSGPHLNFDLAEAVGTYMHTLYSGRCSLDPKPVTMTTDWHAKKIGYETAWKLGRCQARAPGFKVMPSLASKKSITLSAGETMTVQFILPPREDVTVNVSISNPAAAMVGSKTLVFTPENYNVPQSVGIFALPGSATTEVFHVVYSTVSDDEAYNGVSDSWEYSLNRGSSTTTLTRVDKPDQAISTNRNTAASINLGVSGATSGNTKFGGPSNGTVSWSGSNVIYTPRPGFSGKDGFTYAVNTGGVLTVGYVDVTVLFGTNAAPVVDAGTDQTVAITAGGAWNPMLLGPQLWLDANDNTSLTILSGLVSQWSDKSGFNRHASQTGSSARPTPTPAGLNGKQVLTFDGINDNMAINLDFLAGRSHSAFVVTKPTIFSNIYGATDSLAGANSLHVGFSSAGNYRVNHWSDAYTPAVTGNYVAGSANLLNFVWNSGSSKQVLANGKSEGVSGSAGVIGTMSSEGKIGWVTEHAEFGGDLAEFIILTEGVSAVEREMMEGYLAHKWGLAGNLAPAHPYKSAAPEGDYATASLDGTATDSDGDPLTATWSVVSAPARSGMSARGVIDADAFFPVAGTYTLRLTVSDGFTETSDDVVITVNESAETTYPVTYDGNGNTGGTAPAGQTKIQGVDLPLATNSGGLMKDGFTFMGWNTASNGTGTDYAEGASYTTDAALTLYAKWTALPTYTVTYSGNGNNDGTAPSEQTKTHGISLTLATNSGDLVKSGYSFSGWNTAANGTGTDYAAGASYTTDANLMLYAKWTALPTYAVTYDGNGHTGGSAPSSQTKTQGISLNLATNSGDLVKTGHTFVGWNTSSDGTGTDYSPGASYSANATLNLYAKWNALPTVNAGSDQTVILGEAGGGDWTPAATSPAAWFDASDADTITITSGKVTQWADKSENGRHAVATSGREPVVSTAAMNGLDVLTFTSDRLDFPALSATDGEWSFIGVVKLNETAPASADGLLSHSSSTAGSIQVDYRNNVGAGFGISLQNDAGSNQNAHQAALYQTPYAVGQKLISTVFSSTSTKSFFNGNNTTNYTASSVLNSRDMSMRFGVNRSAGNYLDADHAEWIFFSSALGDADREKLEGYLAHKWALKGDLHTDHPYKSDPPTTPGSGALAELDGALGNPETADTVTTIWTVVNGPGPVDFGDASMVDTTATFSTAGTYILRLTANDGFGSRYDDVVITVAAAGLDHFEISSIASPLTVGTAINGITITAKDASNQTVTSFSGTVTYAGTAGITGTSASFTDGVFSGVSITPNNAGSGLTFTVDDGSGHTGSATFTVQSLFAAWTGDSFAHPFIQTDPAQNPDGDNLTNLQEFAFGMDPTSPSAGPMLYAPDGDLTEPGLPTLKDADGNPATIGYNAVFPRLKNYQMAGLTYIVEFSADMKRWTASSAGMEVVTGSGNPSTHEAVSVPFPLTVNLDAGGTAAPKFFRVKVE